MPLAVTQPTTRSPCQDEVGDLLLEEPQVRLRLEQPADGALVELAVGLRAGGAHRRSLAGIQGAKLDARLVRRQRHGAAERIDFLDQMALADAADGRVAAHLPERLDVVGEQQRAPAHARGRERRLGAGMAAADHDHVEFGLKAHHSESTGVSVGQRGLFQKGAYSKPRAGKPPGRRTPAGGG